ncbi:uncharacterized protein METZ01_LOCUS496107 [marine metagenome]|uniref:Uncharacterized protein n=1 Tax=marine metagenome TaxID=408172 RepID=A0A383DG03_9ZZZZ
MAIEISILTTDKEPLKESSKSYQDT